MVRVNNELLAYVTKLYHSENEGYFTMQHYQPEQTVIQQGKYISFVYIIASGIAKCYLSEDNGRDFIQEFFSKGELFGEIEVIHGNLSFCSVEAITDLQVLQIKGENFRKLLKTDGKFNELILKSVANKVRYKAIRHGYNQSHALEDNLLRLIKEFPDLLQSISKQDIANYLGITLRSLNRTLSELNKRDMIQGR